MSFTQRRFFVPELPGFTRYSHCRLTHVVIAYRKVMSWHTSQKGADIARANFETILNKQAKRTGCYVPTPYVTTCAEFVNE